MNRNCEKCRCYRVIRDITVDGGEVLLTPENDCVKPMEAFSWCIQTRYCSPQPTVPVMMVLNDDEIPLWDIYGRPVYSNQIKARKVYNARYVEEGTGHLTVCNVCLNEPVSERPTPPCSPS